MYSQLLIGGQCVARQEEHGVAGVPVGSSCGVSPSKGAALVEAQQLLQHVGDGHQPLVQLCHLWGESKGQGESGL